MGDVTLLADRRPTDKLGAPMHPPRAWFYEPPPWVDPGANGVSVVLHGPETGRAAGYVYDWNTCWLNGTSGACEPIEPSPTGCEVFYSGGSNVISVEGDRIPVGVVPYKGGHAPRHLSAQESRSWMDNPAFQGLVGRVVEDDIGGLFLGQVIPELTVEDAVMIERSKVSGHWCWRYGMRDPDTGRKLGDGYDFIGLSVTSYAAIPRSSSAHGRLPTIEHGYAKVAGIDPDHPNIVGPWVDVATIQEDLMCPRCGLAHSETKSCHEARLAAPDDPPVPPVPPDPPTDPTPTPDPPADPPTPVPDPPASSSTQLANEVQAMSTRLTEIGTQLDSVIERVDAIAARQETDASTLTEIETEVREMQAVELNAEDADRVGEIERALRDVIDRQNTAPAAEAGAPSPTAV